MGCWNSSWDAVTGLFSGSSLSTTYTPQNSIDTSTAASSSAGYGVIPSTSGLSSDTSGSSSLYEAGGATGTPDSNNYSGDDSGEHYTAGKFAENVRNREGLTHTQVKKMKLDAHHRYPRPLEGWFNSRGINIHDPRYGRLVARSLHRSQGRTYTRAWKAFRAGNENASRQEIEAFLQQILENFPGH